MTRKVLAVTRGSALDTTVRNANSVRSACQEFCYVPRTCNTSTSRMKLTRSPRGTTLRATPSFCSPERAIIFTATRVPSLWPLATWASQTRLKAPCPTCRTSRYDSSCSLSGCTSAPASYDSTECAGACAGAVIAIIGLSIEVGEDTRTSSGASSSTNPRWVGRSSSVRRALELENREGKSRDNRGVRGFGTGVPSLSAF